MLSPFFFRRIAPGAAPALSTTLEKVVLSTGVVPDPAPPAHRVVREVVPWVVPGPEAGLICGDIVDTFPCLRGTAVGEDAARRLANNVKNRIGLGRVFACLGKFLGDVG
jgi:hypothetical protein